MDLEDLKQLIKFLKDTDITEVSIETEGKKIKLKREQMLSPFEVRGMPAAPMPAPAQLPQATPAAQPEEDTQHLITVTAPLVGTFYRSPSPEAASYVEVGDRVKKGQVICIIEAMKLMNEIESEADGVVSRALVDNAQPVEYGEPLFLLDPVQE